jgi:predicted transcriptional regulator
MLYHVRLYACYLYTCCVVFDVGSCGVKGELIISWSNRAMPQAATSTDRLANVIQVIQLGRKTGTLTAERDGSTGPEQGIIFFVNGQVTRARVHHLEGTAALQWLNTWSTCRFTFAPSTSQVTTAKLPVVPLDAMLDHETIRGAATPRGSNGQARPDAHTPFQHGPLDDALRAIEQAHLSRAHRRLYLLIDGHRSPAELARLMGRGQHEIDALLRDLERAGVIQR